MADDHNARYRSNDPYGHAPAANQPSGDPLAELARLIGQSDPFAEFGRSSAAPAATPNPSYESDRSQRYENEPEPYHAPQYSDDRGAPAGWREAAASPPPTPAFDPFAQAVHQAPAEGEQHYDSRAFPRSQQFRAAAQPRARGLKPKLAGSRFCSTGFSPGASVLWPAGAAVLRATRAAVVRATRAAVLRAAGAAVLQPGCVYSHGADPGADPRYARAPRRGSVSAELRASDLCSADPADGGSAGLPDFAAAIPSDRRRNAAFGRVLRGRRAGRTPQGLGDRDRRALPCRARHRGRVRLSQHVQRPGLEFGAAGDPCQRRAEQDRAAAGQRRPGDKQAQLRSFRGPRSERAGRGPRRTAGRYRAIWCDRVRRASCSGCAEWRRRRLATGRRQSAERAGRAQARSHRSDPSGSGGIRARAGTGFGAASAAPQRQSVVASAPVNEPVELSPPASRASAPARTTIASRQAQQQPQASANVPLSLAPENGSSPPPARDVAPPRAPVRTASTGGGGSGFHVQISSQRSEADAQTSYRSIQSKYSGVLGDRQAVIRRADLGDKGTYYRAMIGPFSTREQAIQLCGSLKAAGGDCVVQSN